MADLSGAFDAIDQAIGPASAASDAPANDTGAPPLTIRPAAKTPAAQAIDTIQAGIDNKLPAAPKPYQTTAATITNNIGAGADEAIANTLGAPVDAVSWAMRKVGLPIGAAPILGSNNIKQAMGLYGGNPDALQPQNAAERIARGVGGGIASTLVPEAAVGGLAQAGLAETAPKVTSALEAALGSAKSVPAVAANAAVGAAAGAGGSAAAEAVPDQYKPIAQLAGGLIGGGVGAIAAEAPTLARQAIGGAKDYLEPATAAGPQAIADRAMQQATMDRGAAVDALGKAGPLDTSFQASGDMGIGAAERVAATNSPVPFNMRRADQNNARVGVLNNLAPTGDPAEVANTLRSHMADLDAQSAAVEDQARSAAQAKAAAVGGTGTPEAYGAEMRGSLSDAKAAAKANERALWQAVDPYGTLAWPTQSISKAATGIVNAIPKTAEPLAGREAAIFGTAQNLDAVSPFTDVTAFRSRVNDAMREELRQNGETASYRRLTQLRGAVEDAISNGLEHQVAQERQAVARGAMAPENTVEARMTQWKDDLQTGQREAGLAAGERRAGAVSRGRTANTFGDVGATGQTGEGPRGPGSDPGIQGEIPLSNGEEVAPGARPQSPRVPRPRDLHQFIRDSGGMQDPGGDLKAMGFDRIRGFIAKPGQGLSPDRMREAAAEQGYLGAHIDNAMAGTGINDLLDTIASDQRTYSVHDQEAAHAWDTYDANLEEHNRLKAQPSQPAGQRRAAPASAYGQDDAYPGGMSPADLRTDTLQPNVDPAAAERIAAASTATKDRARTFNQGPVGQTLQTQGQQGNFRLLDASVGPKFFKPGPTGAQTVQAFRTAVGNDAEAVQSLQGYAANSFRREVMDGGVVNEAKFKGWQGRYSEALRALPEVGQGFKDAATASETLAKATAARRQALDSYQEGAVGRVMGVSDPADVSRVVGSIFGRNDSVKEMSRVAGLVKNDPEAQQGLRKAVADHIVSRFMSNREAGTTGTDQIAGNAFQTFVRQNRAALSHAFSQPEVESLEAVAADMKRANRSVDAVKLPGGSNTAQDLLAAMKEMPDKQASLLTQLLVGGQAGFLAHGPAGALGGAVVALGKHSLGAARQAGVEKASDLFREMLLNPSLAKAALERVPAEASRGRDVRFRQQLVRVGALAANRQFQGN